MKPILVKNITFTEFKELLEKIEAKTLKQFIDFYYKEYIINKSPIEEAYLHCLERSQPRK